MFEAISKRIDTRFQPVGSSSRGCGTRNSTTHAPLKMFLNFFTENLHSFIIMTGKKEISAEKFQELIQVLKSRFDKNMNRHKEINWTDVQAKLETAQPGKKLWSLYQMEETGGEPDVVAFDKKTGEYVFYDCVAESPKGRRSICYDHEALQSRKEHKPKNSAIGMAAEMGIEILTEAQYRELQQLGKFDIKTSSWIKTPADIRKLGGALFCDWRYGNVFTYHNGAESYYGARGFRGLLKI